MLNEEHNSMPRVINWFSVIQPKNLYENRFEKLPRFFQFDMRLDNDYIFTDVITNPFLLLSREAASVLNMYDDSIKYICSFLFDKKKKVNMIYFLPLISTLDCFGQKGNKVIFILKTSFSYQIIVRMDFIESLLSRGAKGITLKVFKEG